MRFPCIGERGKSTDDTDASLVEWFLSRNACFFDHGFHGLHGFFSHGVGLCLASGVLVFWPTDGTNGYESFFVN